MKTWIKVSRWIVIAAIAASAVGSDRAAEADSSVRLEITVYGSMVRWWGSASGVVVTAELRGPNGTKATAESRASSPSVLIFGSGDPASDVLIMPGDTVIVQPAGEESRQVDVPMLVADADASSGLIAGNTLPHEQVEILLNQDEPLGVVAATPNGSFSLDVSTSRDLAPGDAGIARISTQEGTQFITWWEVMAAQVWLSSGRIELHSSLGSTVRLDVTPPDNRSWGLSYTPGELRTLRCDDCPLLVPGTSLVLTKQSGVDGMSHTWSVVVPDLAIRLDREVNVVHGRGPAGAVLIVNAALYTDARRGHWAVSDMVMPDASGQFDLNLAGRVDLAPGWLAEMNYVPNAAISIIQQDILRVYRVALFGNGIEAVIGPRRPVTVTLSASNGAEKGRGTQTSTMSGDLSFGFGGYRGDQTRGIRIEPGDTLTIDEYMTGDPTVIRVPQVVVHADSQGDAVYGDAPLGYVVDVGAGTGDHEIRVRASRDADQYDADLTGLFDITPGTGGAVIFQDETGGMEFYTAWVAPRIDVIVGRVSTAQALFDGQMAGDGPAGRDVRVTWYSDDGKLVGETVVYVGATGPRVAGRPARWIADLQDSSGAGQEVMPGDRFLIDVGDDSIELIAPELTIAADIGQDTLFGRTLPNTQVTLGVRHHFSSGEVFGKKTISDAGGNYSYDLTGEFDVINRDRLAVSTTLASGHSFQRDGAAPGLLLDLGESYIDGVTLPGAQVEATLGRAGESDLVVRSHSGDDGAFTIELHDQRGQIVVPRPGDTVTVRSVAAGKSEELPLTVPELSFKIDVANQTVIGRASPGGLLHIQALGTEWPREGVEGVGIAGNVAPAITPDGSWQAQGGDFLRDPVTIRPGHEVRATYQLADGNLVQLGQHAFMVNVELGGVHVCGVGPRGSNVSAELTDGAGDVIGAAQSVIDQTERFRFVLRDGQSEPVAAEPGQVIRVSTSGKMEQFTLPESSLAVDWTSSLSGQGAPVARVSGTGPLHTRLYALAPADDCFSGTDLYDGAWLYSEQNGSDPAFTTVVAYQGPGRGIQTAFYLPSDHRVYRQAVRAQARIFVNTDRITGRASSGQQVTLTLQGASGTGHTGAVTNADANGRFDQQMRDMDGASVVIRPGDLVRLETRDSLSDILVEPLTFDFGGIGGLIGVTKPNSTVGITFRFADGSTRWFERQAATDGRFRFGAEDVPIREGWTLGDVQHVELVLPVAGGHEIVAEATTGRPLPAPLLLPLVLVPRWS